MPSSVFMPFCVYNNFILLLNHSIIFEDILNNYTQYVVVPTVHVNLVKGHQSEHLLPGLPL